MDEWDLALALCDVPDEFVMEAANGRTSKKTAWRYRMTIAAAVLLVLLVGSRMFLVRGEAKYKITKIKIENPFQPIDDTLTIDSFYERYPQLIVKDGEECYRAKGVINADGVWKGVLLEFDGRQALIGLETAPYDAVKIDEILDEIEPKNKVYKIGDSLGLCRVIRTERTRKSVLPGFFWVDMEISRKENLRLYACEGADGADVVAIKVEDSQLGELYYLYEKTEREE